MIKITEQMITEERARMAVERELFGRWLSCGTGESQAFWNAQKSKTGLAQRCALVLKRLFRGIS